MAMNGSSTVKNCFSMSWSMRSIQFKNTIRISKRRGKVATKYRHRLKEYLLITLLKTTLRASTNRERTETRSGTFVTSRSSDFFLTEGMVEIIHGASYTVPPIRLELLGKILCQPTYRP